MSKPEASRVVNPLYFKDRVYNTAPIAFVQYAANLDKGLSPWPPPGFSYSFQLRKSNVGEMFGIMQIHVHKGSNDVELLQPVMEQRVLSGSVRLTIEEIYDKSPEDIHWIAPRATFNSAWG